MKKNKQIYIIVILLFIVVVSSAQSNKIYGIYKSNDYYGTVISITNDDSLEFSLSWGLVSCSFKSKFIIKANKIEVLRPQISTEVVVNSCNRQLLQDSVLIRVLTKDSMTFAMASVVVNNKQVFVCNNEGEILVPKSIKIKSIKIGYFPYNIPIIHLRSKRMNCIEIIVDYRDYCETIYIKRMKYNSKKQKLSLVYYEGEYKKTRKFSLHKLK